MDAQGRFLYVTEDSDDHSGSFVVGYSVSSAGALTQIPGTWGNSIPLWEMQGDPSGKYMVGISGKVQYLYGSDDKHIYVYSIDQTTGVLSEVNGSPFATVYPPFNIAMQPNSTNGEFVYSFSVNDADTGTNPIEAYRLNPTTGALSLVSGSPFSITTPTAYGQFDQRGSYMFIYSGVAPNVSLGVLNVASSGALTETLPTTPLVTGGYFAVADVP
jgi:6-phosphogluconolactonase